MLNIGIIGGSGLYQIEDVANVRQLNLETPFGNTSDSLTVGELNGAQLIFIPRHGRGHSLTPSEVPYRANIFALKSLGVNWLISVSAVGSLREELPPGTIVLPNQYIDRTLNRQRTFFSKGLVAHVSVADPTCQNLRKAIVNAANNVGSSIKSGATYVCIEGPAFSTRAESNLYRSWGADIIGMTSIPEIYLAREAEIHYATIAIVTDYDCWKVGTEAVQADIVIENFKKNVDNVKKILSTIVPEIEAIDSIKEECRCTQALAGAILTDHTQIDPQIGETLAPLVKNYL
ncbi:MAG: S-methyl-5'-thioadenosine phosphorylase [Deltaproteobacteria bacterium]|nr:S-methyl-5'-thioadenosine phosphorylase [Deltaproteobacteria bacterium]